MLSYSGQEEAQEEARYNIIIILENNNEVK